MLNHFRIGLGKSLYKFEKLVTIEEKVAYFLTPCWKQMRALDEFDKKQVRKFLFRLMKDVENSPYFPEHSVRPDFKKFDPTKNQDDLFQEQKVQQQEDVTISDSKILLKDDDDDDMTSNIVQVSTPQKPRNCFEEIHRLFEKMATKNERVQCLFF